jgi:hypothetical protein
MLGGGLAKLSMLFLTITHPIANDIFGLPVVSLQACRYRQNWIKRPLPGGCTSSNPE